MGYSLDIPAGALTASPPLDELLRVLGFRVSRDNPTYLEVEVGMGLDLGIVTVETVRIRARIDGPFELSLTKLAASIEIPGTLHGKGSLEFTPLGFKGYFDLTVIPVNLRASAVLAVETRDGVTGVLIGAEVEFPVPLLLGNSGLGIYGFLGGVGVNYARNEAPYAARPVPSLDWLTAQLQRGHVMHPDGWSMEPGAYAFAAGHAARHRRRRVRRAPQGHRAHRGARATPAARHEGGRPQDPTGSEGRQCQRDLPRRPGHRLRARHDHARHRRGLRDQAAAQDPRAGHPRSSTPGTPRTGSSTSAATTTG